MIFSSVSFLFLFLPLTLLLHTLSPARFRNGILLIVSLFFYLYGSREFFVLLLISTLVDFIGGWVQVKTTSRSYKSAVVATSIVINLSLLGYYKYRNFFVQNLNNFLTSLGSEQLPLLEIVLPIGISFYTFQTISYQVDLFRGRVRHQRSFVDFFLYVSLFPQLIAGPIVRYRDIEKDLNERSLSFEEFVDGVRRFITGLAKKAIIADRLNHLTVYAFSRPQEALPLELAWLGSFAFFLQLYFDFSAYSDMAIGLGKMLGFRFPENFRYPFAAKSITEFWQRWHITLMRWFRDYLVAGLRRLPGGKSAKSRNVLAVFVLCGFWHGASWTFVLWGLFHGLIVVIERRWLGRFLQKLPFWLGPVYTLSLCTASGAFFRADSIDHSFLIWRRWLASIEVLRQILSFTSYSIGR